MLVFNISLPTAILTLVLSTGCMQFESVYVAYGQENEIMNEANELIAAANASAAGNALNISDPNFSSQFDDNSGVGYYDPPYSYTQCLTVFTKEMCDFRFNSD